jgi:hypothetical protein
VLSEVHLGGKVIVDIDVTEAQASNAAGSGESLQGKLEMSFGPMGMFGSATIEGSSSSSSEQAVGIDKSAFKSTYKIFGGIPQEGISDGSGFGDWAETVRDYPMPVRYSITPLHRLISMVNKKVDAASYDHALQHYGHVIHVLQKEGAFKSGKFGTSRALGSCSSFYPMNFVNLLAGDDGTLYFKKRKDGENYAFPSYKEHSSSSPSFDLKSPDGKTRLVYAGANKHLAVINAENDVMWLNVELGDMNTDAYETPKSKGEKAEIIASISLNIRNQLVVDDREGNTIWESAVEYVDSPPKDMRICDNGEVYISAHDGTIVWSTATTNGERITRAADRYWGDGKDTRDDAED